MTDLQVDTLRFEFRPDMVATKYDDWAHPRPSGQKAVDVLATEQTDPPTTLWLIEAKDFRVITNPPKPANLTDLHQTVADKVQDSLVGLSDASQSAQDPHEKNFAAHALKTPRKRVVLHLEPHVGPHSRLFPVGFAALVLQKLMPLVASIDPQPLVLNIATTPRAGVPWTVS